MDPVFGWGNECRFSWGTAKEMLEAKGAPCRIDWPAPNDAGDNMRLTGFFAGEDEQTGELASWYGRTVSEEVF